ncbi:MAG: response regulator [Bacteroidota bacterium]
MVPQVKILMLDDHPMTLIGYRAALENVQGIKFSRIDSANSLDEAYLKIKRSTMDPYDLIFLDIRIPSSQDHRFLDGEDFGIMLRKNFPDIKILVLTMLNDITRLHVILKRLNPNGFILKTKLTPEIFQKALSVIIEGNSYYCETVRQVVQEPFEIDDLERKILYYLSLGEKMKNLPNLIPLSMPTIERRKRKLKYLLRANSDKLLLQKAREKGFI